MLLIDSTIKKHIIKSTNFDLSCGKECRGGPADFRIHPEYKTRSGSNHRHPQAGLSRRNGAIAEGLFSAAKIARLKNTSEFASQTSHINRCAHRRTNATIFKS